MGDISKYLETLDELQEDINCDTYHFHDDAQSQIKLQIDELKKLISKYISAETLNGDIW